MKQVKSTDTTVKIGGIEEKEQEKMEAFLQGCIYAWTSIDKNRGEWFSLKEFFNQNNGHEGSWRGTPLQKLYWKQEPEEGGYDKEAGREASKDAGKLLKNAIIKLIIKGKKEGVDFSFDLNDEGYTNKYRWSKTEYRS